jgi:recombination associated protein RdgC
MFKNLQLYRLPAPWTVPADLDVTLATQRFVPITAHELVRHGWASPREDVALVHTVNRQILLRLDTEAKMLPAAVVKRVAKERADELEKAQGFRPGKKAMKELRERVADELLPRAFSRLTSTHVWIDPVNGWLAIDASTSSRADDVIKLLLKCIDKFPVESLRVQRSPVACMTAWLETDEAPVGFTVDQDAELSNASAAVRYVKHALEVDDVRRHIAAGKQCTRLGMTWSDKVSFTLTESLDIKGIRPLDVMQAGVEDADSDFVLMAAEFNALLTDLVGELGGLAVA